MTAITVTWSPKVATDWDPQKPLTTTKLNALYDNTEYLKQWLAGSYLAGAIQDHNHDGQNSAMVPVGPNMLRNGSFESALAGYTSNAYTGGTIATSTSTNMDGNTSLSITSTVLANGGGDVTSNEYMPVTEDMGYSFTGNIIASVANVSAKIEVIWYDKNKSQISIAAAYSSTNTPTAMRNIGSIVAAPETARFARIKVTGGIPSSGSAVGTVYFDGLFFSYGVGANVASAGSRPTGSVQQSGVMSGTTMAKICEFRAPRSGVYTTSMNVNCSIGATNFNAQIYVNGVAVGPFHGPLQGTTPQNFLDDISVAANDLIQLYTNTAGGTVTGTLTLLEAQPIFPTA